MRRLAVATLALALGHALAGAAYVGLINTPDANILMLTTSGLLLLAGAFVLVLTSLLVVRALQVEAPPWRGIGPALRAVPAAVVAVAVAGFLCWMAGAFEAWWTSRAGEVDAAAIAVGDITQTGWLHATVHWGVALVQWILVPCWLAAGLAWALAYGPRHVASLKWLVAGLHPRVVLTAVVAVVLLVWLPWRAIDWRPPGVAGTSLELLFIGVKLGVAYVAANLAWALVLDGAARRTRGA